MTIVALAEHLSGAHAATVLSSAALLAGLAALLAASRAASPSLRPAPVPARSRRIGRR
ncbi:hypothetical protein [Methylobacterium oxalidis]|uniref:hypothetical protein n=1 Tax=Methylobacterium oxalidis TaxID=944322 RepID=UPI0033146797